MEYVLMRGWARDVRQQARDHPESLMINWLVYGLGLVKAPPTDWVAEGWSPHLFDI